MGFFPSHATVALAIAVAWAATAPAASAQSGSWVFVPCAVTSLQIYGNDRLTEIPSVRTVTTDQGQQSITMLDGYRTLYVLPPDQGLLNVKTELLRATTYAVEKKALTSNLEWLARSDPKIGKVSNRQVGSLDIYVVSRDTLQGGTLAIAELFNDASHVVATIYFLNAEPAHRHFQTTEEFVTLRDNVIKDFGRCSSLQGG